MDNPILQWLLALGITLFLLALTHRRYALPWLVLLLLALWGTWRLDVPRDLWELGVLLFLAVEFVLYHGCVRPLLSIVLPSDNNQRENK